MPFRVPERLKDKFSRRKKHAKKETDHGAKDAEIEEAAITEKIA